MNIDTVKNNMKGYESKNVGVRFIEPVKETGRMNPTPTRIRGRQAKKYITAFKIVGYSLANELEENRQKFLHNTEY